MFAADEAVGGRVSGVAAAYEADGRPAKDSAFRGHTWLRREPYVDVTVLDSVKRFREIFFGAKARKL